MQTPYHEEDKCTDALEGGQHVREHGGGGGEGRQEHSAGRLAVARAQAVHELFVFRHAFALALAIEQVACALERIHHNKNVVNGYAQAHEDDKEVDGSKICHLRLGGSKI